MNMDFKGVFTYFLQDKRWKFKMLILGIIILIPFIPFLGFILGTPCYLFEMGYVLLFAHNLINDTDIILPDFEVGKIFKISFKFCGVLLSCSVIIFPLILCVIVPIITIIDAAGDKSNLFTIILQILMFLFSILLGIVYFLSQLIYSERFYYKDVFKIRRVINIFKANWKGYSLLVATFIFVEYIESTAMAFFRNNFLSFNIIIMLSVLINFYLLFVLAYLYTRMYKNSLSTVSDSVFPQN